MPITETCLICKAPLRWIPERGDGEMGGYYVHQDKRAGYRPHHPTPALENPAVEPEPSSNEGVSIVVVEEITLQDTPEGPRWVCTCGWRGKFRTFAVGHAEMVRTAAVAAFPNRRSTARLVDLDGGNKIAVVLKQG